MKIKTLFGIGALAVGLTVASPARADLNVSFSFGLPLPPRILLAPMPPVCGVPVAPVVVIPQPVCPPTVVMPRPVLYIPAGRRWEHDRDGWRFERRDRDNHRRDRDRGRDHRGDRR